MPTKKYNENMHKEQKIFIGVLIAFAVIAVAVAILFPSVFGLGTGKKVDPSLVAIPPVSTTNISKTNGETHSLTTSITLELDKKAQKNADTKTLEGKIMDIMSTLDYDKIMAEDGGDYIKSNIAQGLAQTIPKEQLTDIYITDLQADGAITPQEPKSKANTQRDTLLKGMFKSMK